MKMDCSINGKVDHGRAEPPENTVGCMPRKIQGWTLCVCFRVAKDSPVSSYSSAHDVARLATLLLQLAINCSRASEQKHG
jgi:hypothetical protein